MVALVRDVVVLRLSAEVAGLSQTGFAEEIQRAVNGCQSQVRILSGQLVVHLFGCNMLLLEERVEDQFTLACEFQLVLPQVFLQSSHFFGMFRHGDETNLLEPGLKTKSRGGSSGILQTDLKISPPLTGAFPASYSEPFTHRARRL